MDSTQWPIPHDHKPFAFGKTGLWRVANARPHLPLAEKVGHAEA